MSLLLFRLFWSMRYGTGMLCVLVRRQARAPPLVPPSAVGAWFKIRPLDLAVDDAQRGVLAPGESCSVLLACIVDSCIHLFRPSVNSHVTFHITCVLLPHVSGAGRRAIVVSSEPALGKTLTSYGEYNY